MSNLIRPGRNVHAIKETLYWFLRCSLQSVDGSMPVYAGFHLRR